MRATGGAWLAAAAAATAWATLAQAQEDRAANPVRNAYFGDLHVHTGDSFDSASQGITMDPEEVYRYARGEAVEYLGRMVRRKATLDFVAVTDHAEYMAVYNQARDPSGPFADTDWPRILASTDPEDVAQARRILQTGFRGEGDVVEELLTDEVKRRNWRAVIERADRYYAPGELTTFAGFEWSPTPDGRHHHRNVVFPGPQYPDVPFSALDSTRPQDLWAYAERHRVEGIDSVLIPHNPNLSGGLTFSYEDVDGRPIDRDYAEMRMRNEPVVEVSQVKGSSETHPELSPGDPFAEFEIVEHYQAGVRVPPAGSYVRDAYARGLEIAARTGVNPFAFGLVGSSDFHSALSGTEEDNYTGALGPGDDPTDPAALLSRYNAILNMPVIRISAAGLTGVWAEENTRESIFAALKRKEVFATSGTRMQVRLFAGWSYPEGLTERPGWLETAYAEGAPMGADLAGAPVDAEGGPRFLVDAAKDPNGANLDRIQIVKVWLDEDGSHEKVFDVAWSGDRAPGEDGLVPAVGSTVEPRIRDVHERDRRGPPHGGMARSGVRRGRARRLLRARARDPDAALDDLPRGARRPAPAGRRARRDPGARLDVADLLHAAVNPAPRAREPPSVLQDHRAARAAGAVASALGALGGALLFGAAASAQETHLYWGDTHVHTSWSVDAYAVGDYFTGPDEAYRFAKGAPVLHTRLETRVRIDQPLDFMIVADHAERFRYQVNILDAIPPLADLPGFAQASAIVRENPRTGMGPPPDFDPALLEALLGPEVKGYGWGLQVDAAERHNEPGVFTTFAGWEWTRNEGGNLHRVIFTPDGPDLTKQFIPFSADDGAEPQDLWTWLDETSARTGARFIAIPHNSNLSNGRMFGLETEDGRPIDAAYARQRARWEPVMEITQVKGTSEAHPALSPNDEHAAFEIHTDLLIGGQAEPNEADYARYALLRGLALEALVGVNPYKVGFIGSTDTHTGLSSTDESNFLGKIVRDSLPRERLESPQSAFFHSWEMSASGRAAVWAEENTREAIAAAFERREVYATSGPRIALRVFGGFRFRESDADAADVAAVGYARGVPMGADLTAAPRRRAPQLLIEAVKDPLGANLDRVQVIKGWLDAEGGRHEQVYDAVWAGDRSIDAAGRLAPVGDTVDLTTATYENTIGAARLATLWEDPDFDPAQRAFYYVRVLEIPTPRHSLYDAVALGVDAAATGQPATIQERAWSSPIWYTPGEG